MKIGGPLFKLLKFRDGINRVLNQAWGPSKCRDLYSFTDHTSIKPSLLEGTGVPEMGALCGETKGGWSKDQGAGGSWVSWTVKNRER